MSLRSHFASELHHEFERGFIGFERQASRRHRPISRPVVVGVVAALDGTMTLGAGIGAYLVTPIAANQDRVILALATILASLLAVNVLHLARAYHFDVLVGLRPALLRVATAWAVPVFLIGNASLIAPDAIPPEWVGRWAATGMILLILSRTILRLLAHHWSLSGRLRRNCAVVGAGPVAQRLIRQLHRRHGDDVEIIGVFDEVDGRDRRWSMGHLVEPLANLSQRARNGAVDDVVIAVPLAEQWRIEEIVAQVRELALNIRLCVDEIGSAVGGVSEFAGAALLDIDAPPLRDGHAVAKRVEDFVLALLSLVAFSPVLLLIAAGIKWDSPGPILFRQRRYGLNSEPISIFKFRTMYHDTRDADCQQQTTRHDPRVTRFGRWLRRASLDELPQLLNVLVGDMSIVGPRPHALATKADGVLFEDAVRHYGARHRVKPGITGWAQVNGWRGETRTLDDIQKRVEHDRYYIEHWSLHFDFLILLRTLRCGFFHHRAY